MSPQSIYYYEEKFKEYIMKALTDDQLISFNQLLKDLICEYPEDDHVIHYAFLNVKNELTGFNNGSENEEEICERFKHI